MISLRKSVDDLSRLEDAAKREELHRVILDCYRMAIHSTAHYAVEVDPGLALEFRAHLKTVEDQSVAAVSAEQLQSAQASFRGELRDYRDKSAAHLQKLRKEMESATAAMKVFADTVACNGENHDVEVSQQLRTLESAARSNNIDEIRRGVGSAVVGIQTSVDNIQRANQLVIAQLQDEIRILHMEVEQERRALCTDRASGVWNRQKLDIHLDNLLRQNRSFCVVLVWVRNLKRIESQHSRTVVEGMLKALAMRFAALGGDDAVIGRWSEDQFAAVLDLAPSYAMALSTEAGRKLSGVYAVQENGLSQRVTVQATAGVIDRASNADFATFRQKLAQLASAISGA